MDYYCEEIERVIILGEPPCHKCLVLNWNNDMAEYYGGKTEMTRVSAPVTAEKPWA